MSASTHRAYRSCFLTAGGLAALLSAAACDKIPGLSSGKSADAASASALTAASATAAVPAKPVVLPSDVLATVNGTPISKADLEVQLHQRQLFIQASGGTWSPLTPEEMERLLNETVDAELVSQDAVARGLGRTLDTQNRWEVLRRQFFSQEWARWHQARVEVTPEDIDKFYEEHKQGFREPVQIKVRQMVVASEDQAKRALAQLLDGTGDFTTLAKQISLGPTASQGGELKSWVMRDNDKKRLFATEAEAEASHVMSLDAVLEAAAFAIDKVNGLSNYVKGADNQYHIFQLIERREEKQRAKSEVSDWIKLTLQQQKMEAAIEELRGKATIERHPDRLGGVSQP